MFVLFPTMIDDGYRTPKKKIDHNVIDDIPTQDLIHNIIKRDGFPFVLAKQQF